MQFWAPDDGRKNCLKHVGRLTEINKFWNVASCWLYSKNILAMHGPMNVTFRRWSACGPLCHVVVKYSDFWRNLLASSGWLNWFRWILKWFFKEHFLDFVGWFEVVWPITATEGSTWGTGLSLADRSYSLERFLTYHTLHTAWRPAKLNVLTL